MRCETYSEALDDVSKYKAAGISAKPLNDGQCRRPATRRVTLLEQRKKQLTLCGNCARRWKNWTGAVIDKI